MVLLLKKIFMVPLKKRRTAMIRFRDLSMNHYSISKDTLMQHWANIRHKFRVEIAEWDEYRMQMTQWEIDRYLEIY